jgi:hypothetical protein
MAKRSRPPPIEFEPLAELGRKYVRPRLLDEWNRREADMFPPTEQDLRNICLFLLDKPELIGSGGPYAFYIYLALKSLVAKIPNRPFEPKQMAALVDMLVDVGMPLSKARQEIADRSKKTTEAVKQAHLRYGKRKRDKTR